MREAVVPSQYLQIALDLARRIARGELPEGSRVYGRSVLASEYNVSPETVRRAVRLLADMKVVEVKPQSGAVVLSADSARRYIEGLGESDTVRALRSQLKELLEESAALQRRIGETVAALVQSRNSFASREEPLPNYDVPVPQGSPCTGRSIGELQFWQATGATVGAIRRGRTLILSPGPYAELYGGDILVLIGGPEGAESARRLLSGETGAPEERKGGIS